MRKQHEPFVVVKTSASDRSSRARFATFSAAHAAWADGKRRAGLYVENKCANEVQERFLTARRTMSIYDSGRVVLRAFGWDGPALLSTKDMLKIVDFMTGHRDWDMELEELIQYA